MLAHTHQRSSVSHNIVSISCEAQEHVQIQAGGLVTSVAGQTRVYVYTVHNSTFGQNAPTVATSFAEVSLPEPTVQVVESIQIEPETSRQAEPVSEPKPIAVTVEPQERVASVEIPTRVSVNKVSEPSLMPRVFEPIEVPTSFKLRSVSQLIHLDDSPPSRGHKKRTVVRSHRLSCDAPAPHRGMEAQRHRYDHPQIGPP